MHSVGLSFLFDLCAGGGGGGIQFEAIGGAVGPDRAVQRGAGFDAASHGGEFGLGCR